VQNENEEWWIPKDVKKLVLGYTKDAWQGAPWPETNLAWVKRPVYLIEGKPKDKYYNYGTQTMWVDMQKYSITYKVINDRSGKYWKTLVKPDSGLVSKDEKMKFVVISAHIMVDERTDHASTITGFGDRRTVSQYNAQMDINDFSLAGFQGYCK